VDQDQLLALVADEVGGPHNITLATRIDALGVDSLEFLSLMQAIEKKFGKEIPSAKFADIDTVGDILKAMA
jgi:acyl carrier protein